MKNSGNRRHDYDERSSLGMLAEIGRLLLVLLLRYVGRGWSVCRVFLWRVVRLLCKGLLYVIDGIDIGATALNRFWTEHSMQEKVLRMRRALSSAMGAFSRGVVRAAVCTWTVLRFIARYTWTALLWFARYAWTCLRWFAVHAVQWAWLFCRGVVWTVIHLRRALDIARRGSYIAAHALWRAAVWLWAGACRTGRAVWRWMRRCQIGYLRFRRNGGVKGLLVRWVTRLRSAVSDVMEERDGAIDLPTEELDGAADGEEYIDPDLDDTDPERLYDQENPVDEDDHRIHTFGRGFYRALRRIVEEDN